MSPQTFFQSLPEPIKVSCRTAASVKSVEEVVNLTKEPKIFRLQAVDDTATYKVIGRILMKMVKDMNLPNGLSTSNIIDLAKRFVTDDDIRYWLTIPDISLLCRRIADGYYGAIYGHFGIPEFTKCLIQYCNERRECHRIQNSRNVEENKRDIVNNVGYSIDENGRLVIPVEKQGVKKREQTRFIYDENGNIKGENMLFWNKYRKEKTPEEMAEINKNNKIMERAHEILKNDPNVPLMDAIEQATAEFEKS